MINKDLWVYNSLTRKKEQFQPLNPPFVGMYVCGPTVYGEPHLGHARAYITFDLVFRYLRYLDFKVRYVRNITDVGHLEHDRDEGEDKIAKKAKLEQQEPMEVVKFYTDAFHQAMERLNILPPNIEPQASGHIPEQIDMVEKILKNGYAYESGGSVYFDVLKYAREHNYGELSGRNPEELMSGTRELDGQSEKRNPLDFALWKNASPEHIMKWDSPWGKGFPGWHLECSAMSAKYLGNTFDIHGGGMDLLFPHHESEVAQAKACCGQQPVRYWLHNNMVTINGQKMGKSLGNYITLSQLFSGGHELLERAYSPMTIRFFILQAHYRSTVDFSNEALQAARKAYTKLMNGLRVLEKLDAGSAGQSPDEKLNSEISRYLDGCFEGMNDDFNSAVTISNLFNLLKHINTFNAKAEELARVSTEEFERLKREVPVIVREILGLREEPIENSETLIDGLLEIYREAKLAKDYDKVDKIRAIFRKEGLVIKDMKHGIDWAYEE